MDRSQGGRKHLRYQKYPSKENNSGHGNAADAAPAAVLYKAGVASHATRQAAVMLAQQQQLQQQQQNDIQRLSIASSASTQSSAYGSDAPTLQPAYQPLQSQQHLSRRAAPAAMSDGHWESLAEMSSAIRHDVDQFLVALPLGTGPDDAAVEEAVQSKLFEALLSKAVMQHKLTDWCATCLLHVYHSVLHCAVSLISVSDQVSCVDFSPYRP
ncbi:hypothetical protein ABBQ32_003513 [Trebouxia sp. C0010 RCD-2024]